VIGQYADVNVEDDGRLALQGCCNNSLVVQELRCRGVQTHPKNFCQKFEQNLRKIGDRSSTVFNKINEIILFYY